MSSLYDRYWKMHRFSTLSDFNYKWSCINQLIPTKTNITILDYGCGPGLVISEMKNINPQVKYIGMDVSEKAIQKAKITHKGDQFFKVNDGEKLPLKGNSVDFILTTDVIEHVYDTRKIFEEFYRVLKPNGTILMTTPYHGLVKNLIIVLFAFDKIFDPLKNHIRFYSKNSLFKVFKMYNFRIEKYGYFGRFYPIWRGIYVLARKPQK